MPINRESVIRNVERPIAVPAGLERGKADSLPLAPPAAAGEEVLECLSQVDEGTLNRRFANRECPRVFRRPNALEGKPQL
jgi:hypothetical protein